MLFITIFLKKKCLASTTIYKIYLVKIFYIKYYDINIKNMEILNQFEYE